MANFGRFPRSIQKILARIPCIGKLRRLVDYCVGVFYTVLNIKAPARHADLFITAEEIGARRQCYLPTFHFPGAFINRSHRFLSEWGRDQIRLPALKTRAPEGFDIEGDLLVVEALKLYEMGFFSSGDILELGCGTGLSTCILSQANHDSPYRKTILTVDLSSDAVETTRGLLRQEGLDTYVTAVCDDATALIEKLEREGKRFTFIFIDHSHTYRDVLAACKRLGGVIAKGGFCLFHDFNDRRNLDENEPDYGVYQAVMEGLSREDFAFFGAYGSSALYRSTSA